MVSSRNLRILLGLERTGHEPTLDEMLPPLPKKDRSSQAKRFEAALSDGTEFETEVVLPTGGGGRTCRITCRVRRQSESEVTHAYGLLSVRGRHVPGPPRRRQANPLAIFSAPEA